MKIIVEMHGCISYHNTQSMSIPVRSLRVHNQETEAHYGRIVKKIYSLSKYLKWSDLQESVEDRSPTAAGVLLQIPHSESVQKPSWLVIAPYTSFKIKLENQKKQIQNVEHKTDKKQLLVAIKHHRISEWRKFRAYWTFVCHFRNRSALLQVLKDDFGT